MANSIFSKIVKSIWVLVSFIPFLNGLGFAYIGAKEFNGNWIKEGLIYELPWFLAFLFINSESILTFFVILGLVMQLVSIIRSFYVYMNNKDVLIDDDPESKVVVEKSISSFWVIFCVIPYLNGLGIFIIGLVKGAKQWIIEGLFFEFLWIFTFIAISFNYDTNFAVSIGMIGLIISIIRTFMIYFEEEKTVMDSFITQKEITDTLKIDTTPKPVEKTNKISDSEIIPEFKGYNDKIIELKDTFDKKEDNITNLINNRFAKGELTYDRFNSVINNCHKIFYHHADSATSIIHLAPEYSERLDESIKGKISILESLNGEMNNLIEELIIHDGDDKKSDEDLKELFSNMDNLINSVKDYK